jgi:hypothetical protein
MDIKSMTSEQLIETLDLCLQIAATGIEMRVKQKVYFRERTHQALIEARQLESKFDKLCIGFREAKDEGPA